MVTMPTSFLMVPAFLALAGCGLILGPPVDCKVQPVEEGEYHHGDRNFRDLVCTAKKDLDDYWVIIEYEQWGEPYTSTYGHHGVKAGDVQHHPEAKLGAKVTVKAEGFRPRIFTVW